MYSYLADPEIKNVAVLDITHGGIIISRKLKDIGFNVTAVDVYGTLSQAQRRSLEEDNIEVVTDINCAVERFDLIISPVHLTPVHCVLQQARERQIPIISHHLAVRDLLATRNMFSKPLVIEVTGTKAKTSTASVLADIISRELSVLLHTSRGLEYWEDGVCQMMHKGLSITPASILTVMDLRESLGKKAEVCIFEVSLGITGYGDVGIITTLDMDYKIGGKTSLASEVKVRSLLSCSKNALIILNAKSRESLKQLKISPESICIKTFDVVDEKTGIVSDTDYCLTMHDNRISIKCTGEEMEICLADGYDAKSYTTAFAASCVTALEMGISWKKIKETVEQFKGLQGRMQGMRIDGTTVIDNSNSGMDILSVEKALDLCLKRRQLVIMVLGEEAAQVCEGLSPADVADLLRRRQGDMYELILVGERMKPLATGNIHYAESFDMGRDNALEMARKKNPDEVIIALCVKCFR